VGTERGRILLSLVRRGACVGFVRGCAFVKSGGGRFVGGLRLQLVQRVGAGVVHTRLLQSVGKVAQEAAGSSGAVEGRLLVDVAGEFQNDGAVEADGSHLAEEAEPVDLPVARRQMVVVATVVVGGVHHPEVAGQFVGHGAQVAGEVGVAGVQADADFGRFQGAEDPEQMAHASGEQVGQHILQDEGGPALAAGSRYFVEHLGRTVLQGLVVRAEGEANDAGMQGVAVFGQVEGNDFPAARPPGDFHVGQLERNGRPATRIAQYLVCEELPSAVT